MDNHHCSTGRRSIRLEGYDYSAPGAYFVTILTHQRENLFGEIEKNEMILNRYGEIARLEWYKTANVRPYIQLDQNAFVIMPNHVHGIIWIVETDKGCKGAAPLRPYGINSLHVIPKSLGAIIRAFKSAVSYQINALRNNRGISVWHRNYFEHIIRNQVELERITQYIITNPSNWHHDSEYKDSSG